MTIEHRDCDRCHLCGCTRLQVDEVECNGILLLVECPRCRHRRTGRPPATGWAQRREATSPPLPPRGSVSPAVADAA